MGPVERTLYVGQTLFVLFISKKSDDGELIPLRS